MRSHSSNLEKPVVTKTQVELNPYNDLHAQTGKYLRNSPFFEVQGERLELTAAG